MCGVFVIRLLLGPGTLRPEASGGMSGVYRRCHIVGSCWADGRFSRLALA